nr:MAG TPA: hypothetical protein [Caudoviricetes sp.]
MFVFISILSVKRCSVVKIKRNKHHLHRQCLLPMLR